MKTKKAQDTPKCVPKKLSGHTLMITADLTLLIHLAAERMDDVVVDLSMM
jgi:hypothetical protein